MSGFDTWQGAAFLQDIDEVYGAFVRVDQVGLVRPGCSISNSFSPPGLSGCVYILGLALGEASSLLNVDAG